VALKGTLKDFGIAEIFQLIGHQAKSGVLHLKSKEDEIHIFFADGCVVRAEFAGRKSREKLGNLLVRAAIINEGQLQEALDTQKRTLKRLGDILVQMKFVEIEVLREMTALQTTETIYKLFHWKTGTYEFEPGAVEYDRESVNPLRSESVLMEGFRQVDEWPVIKRKITSTGMTFERLRTIPPPQGFEPAGAGGAFTREKSEMVEISKGEFANLGSKERKVYALADEGATVETIIDLSRLGEFETCKSLLNLINLGVLKGIAASKMSPAAQVGAFARDWQGAVKRTLVNAAVTISIATLLAGVLFYVSDRGLAAALSGDPGGGVFRDNSGQRFLSRSQVARLGGALEVFRLEKGEYPEKLEALVEAGLVGQRDLQYPFDTAYYYRRRAEGGFVLLPPIP
jgi:hypothetical protein